MTLFTHVRFDMDFCKDSAPQSMSDTMTSCILWMWIRFLPQLLHAHSDLYPHRRKKSAGEISSMSLVFWQKHRGLALVNDNRANSWAILLGICWTPSAHLQHESYCQPWISAIEIHIGFECRPVHRAFQTIYIIIDTTNRSHVSLMLTFTSTYPLCV